MCPSCPPTPLPVLVCALLLESAVISNVLTLGGALNPGLHQLPGCGDGDGGGGLLLGDSQGEDFEKTQHWGVSMDPILWAAGSVLVWELMLI